MPNNRILAALAVLGLCASGPVLAQSETPVPWKGDFWGYLGASAGQSKFSTGCVGPYNCDLKDTAFRVYAGGKFTDYVSLEAGYVGFGRTDSNGGDTNAWAVPFTLVMGGPLGRGFSAFGKLGGLYGRTDTTVNATTLLPSGSRSGWGWTYGVGAAYSIASNFDVRIDWDRYKLDFADGHHDVDMLGAGVQVRF
jgi:opacity protein-like surface antigen